MQVYVFDARLEADTRIRRRIALRADQKLTDLHAALQEAYEWADDHLYAFWLSGRFWDRQSREYTIPFELEPHQRSAATRLSRLGLERGQKIAYLFDFGDEWRVVLTVASIEAADDGRYPRVLERQGDAPPQYPDYEEELIEADRRGPARRHHPATTSAAAGHDRRRWRRSTATSNGSSKRLAGR